MMSSNYTTIDNQNVFGSVPIVADPPPHVAVKFTESNLQTFPPSSSHGKISRGSGPPRDVDDSFSKRASGSDVPQQIGWLSAFTIAAYKPYFDVDTSDVLERIKYYLSHLGGAFTEKTSSSPDLYGPFWICTTLIFVAASIDTFVTYLSHTIHNKEWDYDINLVTWSAGLFYGYVLIVPLFLFVILKYLSAPARLVQLFCLYGYFLLIFIFALCLSVIPFEIFRWVVAGVAGFMSATFVGLNLRAHIVSAGESTTPSRIVKDAHECNSWNCNTLVKDVKYILNQIGYDFDLIHQMVSGLVSYEDPLILSVNRVNAKAVGKGDKTTVWDRCGLYVLRALEDKVMPYCDDIMTLLLKDFSSNQLHRSVKPPIVSSFGDIALAIREQFEKYLMYDMPLLQSAAELSAHTSGADDEMLEYTKLLRNGIL